MSSVQDSSGSSSLKVTNLKLEVIVVPVTDVQRAKDFYERLGWRIDADVARDEFRLLQITPPGSGCSIQFGTDLTTASPGSARGLYLVVSDIESARAQLVALGADVSEVFHEAELGDRFRPVGDVRRLGGPAAEHQTYGSFASFEDPDGNVWLVQEISTRLPGRVDSAATSFAYQGDLAGALRRAAAAHGEHEARIGREDPEWPDWYADYMVREQAGEQLPS